MYPYPPPRTVTYIQPVLTNPSQPCIVTRSHKYNERIHSGSSNNIAAHEAEQLPRFFGKAGHTDTDPRKTKKNGGGKSNWGHLGEEKDDYGYTFANSRRYSNSSSHDIKEFRSKFEAIEPEPVYEEAIHGPLPDSDETVLSKSNTTVSTSSSSSSRAELREREEEL